MKTTLVARVCVQSIGKIIATFILSFSASPVIANSITIPNSGFEELILSGPGGAGNFSNQIPNWNVTGLGGTFKPGATQFPGGVTEGVNVAWIGDGRGGGTVSQILSSTLLSNSTYELMVDIGNRLDNQLPFYTIELIAGGVTLVTSSSTTPIAGTFLTDSVTYQSGSNPVQVGQNLEIRLSTSGSGQTNFDNIRLTVVPIPAAAWLFLAGIGLLVIFARRKKVSHT